MVRYLLVADPKGGVTDSPGYKIEWYAIMDNNNTLMASIAINLCPGYLSENTLSYKLKCAGLNTQKKEASK